MVNLQEEILKQAIAELKAEKHQIRPLHKVMMRKAISVTSRKMQKLLYELQDWDKKEWFIITDFRLRPWWWEFRGSLVLGVATHNIEVKDDNERNRGINSFIYGRYALNGNPIPTKRNITETKMTYEYMMLDIRHLSGREYWSLVGELKKRGIRLSDVNFNDSEDWGKKWQKD